MKFQKFLKDLLFGLYTNIKFLVRLIRRRRLFAFISSIEMNKDAHGQVVVSNLANTALYRNLLFESFLAIKLRKQGAQAFVLLDDGVLNSYDDLHCDDFINRYKMAFCRLVVRKFIKKNASCFKYYSEFITKADLEHIASSAERMVQKNNFVYKGLDLWPDIAASLGRFYKSMSRYLTQEEGYEKALRRYTENAMISCLLAHRIEEKLKPHAIVTLHGFYTVWGPFFRYYKKQRGRKAFVYAYTGFSKNIVKYRHRPAYEQFAEIKEQIDYKEAEAFALQCMEKRFAFQTRDLRRYGIYDSNHEILSVIEQVARGRRLYALFPNVLWDLKFSTNSSTIFETPVCWIRETIGHFLSDGQKVLIVKAHPAEASTMKSRLGVRDLVGELLGEELDPQTVSVRENIIFIPASVKLKSYTLFDVITAGATYNGTLGLEMMYNHIPVIVGGEAPYYETSFTKKWRHKEEYFSAFDNVEVVLRHQEEYRADLLKFIYLYFCLREMPRNYFGTDRDMVVPPEQILADRTISHIAADILEHETETLLLPLTHRDHSHQ